ncbi:hypothetical protein GXP67_31555 [Rhodocytophaga rosea]|uniref:Uncharacterized protein n=1 Tax=Rhodocytophaga rosea TaxID=2704465 RepID=A0A6C0GTK1_9BACT|nr:hypothetical protein [Rhodocytophaga rosea]QHT70863.1 hypothetical protein GXP67_31555 [Rhodocytophaga rosea]
METIAVDQNRSELISSLELLSYRAARLLEESNNRIFYSDYYTFYTGYTHYLASLKWQDEQLKRLIDSFPVLTKPVFTSNPIGVVIPVLLVAIYPVNLIYLPIYYLGIAGTYGWVKYRNDKRLREILQISQQVLLRL